MSLGIPSTSVVHAWYCRTKRSISHAFESFLIVVLSSTPYSYLFEISIRERFEGEASQFSSPPAFTIHTSPSELHFTQRVAPSPIIGKRSLAPSYSRRQSRLPSGACPPPHKNKQSLLLFSSPARHHHSDFFATTSHRSTTTTFLHNHIIRQHHSATITIIITAGAATTTSKSDEESGEYCEVGGWEESGRG